MSSSRSRGRRSVPSETIRLAEQLLAGAQPPDLGAWTAVFAEGIHLRMANRPPALHRNAAAREIQWLFRRTAGLGAAFRVMWPSDDGETVLMELDLQPMVGGESIHIAIVLRAIPPLLLVQDLRFYLHPGALIPPGNGYDKVMTASN